MKHVNSQSFFLVRAPTSVAIGRRRVSDLINAWCVTLDDDSNMAMTTVVSELVTNAVSHGTGTMLEVIVRADAGRGRLTVEVHDESPVLPRTCFPGPDAENGRGMVLIEHLAIAHGAERTLRGKRVWAEFELPPRPASGPSPDPRPALRAARLRFPDIRWPRLRAGLRIAALLHAR